MRISSRRWVYLTAIVVDLGLVTLVACGSSTDMSSGDGGGDGGGEGSSHHPGDASLRDGPSGDAVGDAGHADAPTPGAGAIAFCEADWMTSERCKLESPACVSAYFDASFEAALEKYVDECAVGWSEFESNAYLGALAKCYLGKVDCCAFAGTCNDAAVVQAVEAGPCIGQGVASVPPDPEDEKLKADYCKACPDTASKYPACSGFFSFAEAGVLDSSFFDASGLGGVDIGFGAFALAWSDPVVAAVDQACTGDALATYDAGEGVTDCYERFVFCAEATFQAYVKAHTPPPVDAASIPAACRMDGG
jgi:hypothetical protein